jgi:hypothetical protein
VNEIIAYGIGIAVLIILILSIIDWAIVRFKPPLCHKCNGSVHLDTTSEEYVIVCTCRNCGETWESPKPFKIYLSNKRDFS